MILAYCYPANLNYRFGHWYHRYILEIKIFLYCKSFYVYLMMHKINFIYTIFVSQHFSRYIIFRFASIDLYVTDAKREKYINFRVIFLAYVAFAAQLNRLRALNCGANCDWRISHFTSVSDAAKPLWYFRVELWQVKGCVAHTLPEDCLVIGWQTVPQGMAFLWD